jgi:predicted transcriptional regulator
LAKAVAIPITDDSYLGLPSEKVLLGLLAANAIQILAWMGNQLWSIKNKKEDKTEEKMDSLSESVHRIEEQIKHLYERVKETPDRDEIIESLEHKIELQILKHFREFK